MTQFSTLLDYLTGQRDAFVKSAEYYKDDAEHGQRAQAQVERFSAWIAALLAASIEGFEMREQRDAAQYRLARERSDAQTLRSERDEARADQKRSLAVRRIYARQCETLRAERDAAIAEHHADAAQTLEFEDDMQALIDEQRIRAERAEQQRGEAYTVIAALRAQRDEAYVTLTRTRSESQRALAEQRTSHMRTRAEHAKTLRAAKYMRDVLSQLQRQPFYASLDEVADETIARDIYGDACRVRADVRADAR